MADVGTAPQPPVAPGALAYQKLLSGGYSADEANQWQARQTATLRAGGFKQDEIDNYWGNKTPSTAAIDALHGANPDIQKATNWYEALTAGVQMSDPGPNDKLTTVPPEHAGFLDTVTAAMGQETGTNPTTATEAVMSPSTPTNFAIGDTNALAQATREILVDGQNKGDYSSWLQFYPALVAGILHTAKAGDDAGKKPFLAPGADVSGQAVTATAAGSALASRVPDASSWARASVDLLASGYSSGVSSAFGQVKQDLLAHWPDLAAIKDETVWGNVQRHFQADLALGRTPLDALAAAFSLTGIPQLMAKGSELLATAEVKGTRAVIPAVPGRPSEQQDIENLKSKILFDLQFAMPIAKAGRVVGSGGGQKFLPTEAGARVQKNLQTIYRQYGIAPDIAVKMAKQNPGLRGEILAQDVNGDPVTPHFRLGAPDEPPRPGKAADAKPIGDPVEDLLPKVRGLESSGDNAISPKGAVGRYQIMPGTARQYGFDPSRLTDPAYNEMVARHVLSDLNRRFRGDEDAILTAYNAGPGRAAALLKAGPGTALEATHGPHGWTYERVPAQRSEAGLPLETQEYLARSRKGAPPGGGGGEGGPPKLSAPEGGEEDPFKLNTDMRVQRLLDRIGEPSTAHQPLLSGFEMDLDAARGVDNELRTRGLLNPNDVGIEDMARSTYASDSRTDHFLMRGPFDPITLEPKAGTSAKDVLDAINKIGGNRDEFNTYRVSMRTIEKARQGIDVGVIPLKEAEANAADPQLNRYAKIDAMMQDFKHGVLEYVRDSGGISQKQLDAMEAANTSHVSLRRIMGDDVAFAPRGRGFKAFNPIARMEGSDKKIVDPWLADMDNARMMIRFADRNRAAGAVVGAQEGIPAAPGVMRLAPGEAKATLAEPGSNTFKPYGLDDKEAEAFAPFYTQPTGAKNTSRFTFWRDGKPEVYEATDPNLARMYRNAESPGEASLITKAVQLPAKLQRAGIVIDPTFGVRVGLKHQITAFIASPLHPPPFVTMLGSVLDVLGKSDRYWEFVRSGGLSGSMVDIDKNMVQTDAQKLLAETGVNGVMYNLVHHPIEMAQMVSDRMSQAARMGVYKLGVKKGLGPLKAGMEARKAMLDYSEQFILNGMNQWARAVPFFKPDVLGIRQGGAAVWGAKKAISTAAFVTLGLVMPQIGLYFANRTQDKNLPVGQRYIDIPRWERDNYFITPQIFGQRIKIGKPFNFGPLIGVPLEHFLEKEFEDHPYDYDEILNAWAQPLPTGIPPVAKPVLEHVADHNFFTGRPLIPDSMKDLSPHLQYTPATSTPAREIASVLGPDHLNWAEVSPIVIDNYARNLTGTVGQTVLKALNQPFTNTGRPWEMADIPFVGSFFVRNPGTSAQPIEDFYTKLHEFETQHADLKWGFDHQDPAVINRSTPEAKLYERLFTISHALKIERQIIQGAYDNKDMTVDEKRQLTDKTVSDMIGLADGGSKAMSGLK